MRRFTAALRALLAAILLVGGVITVLLSFFLASRPYQDPTSHHTYTFFDATYLLFVKLYGVVFAPSTLSRGEHDLLSYYGNAIVLLVSLAAVGFSSVAVISKLAAVGELVPFEKFDLWYGFIIRNLPLVKHAAKAHGIVERWKATAYKNLSVKKMVHYYESGDCLLIMSGYYSWLFDNPWSTRSREIILRKLPHSVRLVSYKTPREVADFWRQFPDMRLARDIFAAMAFAKTSESYNGSIVNTGQTALYIYLYREAHRSSRRSSVCVFHGDREAGTLVRLVADEMRRLHASALLDTEREREKQEILQDPDYFG